MILITGVRFRKSSKVYYFDPTGYDVKKGDHVIVETARGVEYGTVVLGPKEITDDKVVSPLKPLIRTATPEDDETQRENEEKEQEAFGICLEKIKKHNLEMKLIDSEYTFDRNKLLFYFTADGRIDFRELVKDLASVFRTRIELRQIGVRDETKLLGGVAICGRPLCCHTFLSDFAPVSIKMAKEQGLSLNPTQISGVCGRLMCCLKNEQEAYEHLNSTLPAIGSQVKTVDGYTGEVQSTSVLKQCVKVIITKKNGDREVCEYPVSDLSFIDHRHSKNSFNEEIGIEQLVNPEELEQLQLMELQDMEELAGEEEKPPVQHNSRHQRNSKPDYKRDKKMPPRDKERRASHSRGGYDHQEQGSRRERSRYDHTRDDGYRSDRKRGEHMGRDSLNPGQRSRDSGRSTRPNTTGHRRSGNRNRNHDNAPE